MIGLETCEVSTIRECMLIRVVHIITGLSTGGAERMLLKLLSRTDRTRFAPVVISLVDKGEVGSQVEALGVPLHTLNVARGMPSPAGLWRLVRILRRERPDIIQSWMYHGNIAAQLASWLYRPGTPVVWNIRGTHTNLAREPFLTALVIWLGARLSRQPVVIVNNSRTSATSHEQLLGYRGDRWRILPNGFDTENFVPSDDARSAIRASLGLPADALLISLVGRYHPVKGHADFLRAATILLKDYPSVHFVLVGQDVVDGNVALAHLLKDSSLRAAVHLLGPREDMATVTAAADIATSASLSEGFSNSIGEAMSCGVPCVATDVGEASWIIGSTGRIVPASSPAALAAAWSELLAMGAEARRSLGRSARQRVLREFSLDAVVRQYEALYDEVLFAHRGHV